MRAAHPGVALWLDCGSHEALLRALPAVPAPVAVNAVFLGTAGAAALLRAALDRGAGVVLSPLSSDRGAPLSVEALIEVAVAAAAELAGHSAAAAWLDCLAPPASSDRGRLERSLALARRLAREPAPAPRLRPLLAVGNVGHGAPGGARPALRAVYAAAATGAGAAALIAPLEQAALRAAVAVAGGAARPPARPSAGCGMSPPRPRPECRCRRRAAPSWTRALGSGRPGSCSPASCARTSGAAARG